MQKMLGPALLLNIILLIFSVVEAAEFTITLDGDEKFNFTWSYDGTSNDDFISLLLQWAYFPSKKNKWYYVYFDTI